MFRLKRHIFLLYCLATGALSIFPYLLLAPPVVALNEDRFDAGDVMLQATLNAYGPDGRRRYRTESAKLSHLHEDGLLVFEQFRMRYYSRDMQIVSLRSEHGTASDATELIELDGAVLMERFEKDGRMQERVTTRDVDIHTDRWIAVTAEEAVLERNGLTTTGRGMIADLRQGTINLLGEVGTSHEM